MSEVIESVGQLLGLAERGLHDAKVEWIDEDETVALVAKTLKRLPALLGEDITGDIATAFDSVLAIPLGDILAKAWNTRRDLLEYLDPKKHPPADLGEVVLEKPKVERKLKPKIEILVDQQHLADIAFELTVELNFEAVVLQIRNAKIIGARTGSCEGKGTLTLGKAILAAPKTRKFSLPGKLSFGEGIPIRDLTLGA